MSDEEKSLFIGNWLVDILDNHKNHKKQQWIDSARKNMNKSKKLTLRRLAMSDDEDDTNFEVPEDPYEYRHYILQRKASAKAEAAIDALEDEKWLDY